MTKPTTNTNRVTGPTGESSTEDLRVGARSAASGAADGPDKAAEAARATVGEQPWRITGDRLFDHNHECVGCGAHLSEPCHPACPFETGMFSLAVLLRAAARRLRENPAGVGYDISAAVFAAGLDLVGEHAAAAVADEAREVLTGYLIDTWGSGAEAIRTGVVYRHGLFTDLPEIALSLYAAAARHDGIDFDPDSFGDFSA